MKFTKIVILASALAVSAFPNIAHSQDAATSKTEAPPATVEEAKAKSLQKTIGKLCQVSLDGDRVEDFHEGIVKSVTTKWLVLENEGEEEENGKTVKVKNRIYLPLMEVNSITVHDPDLGLTNPYKAKQSSK